MSKAIVYLKAAAEIAANAEDSALKAGLAKGGKFKSELTLALFELGNCFRNGWVFAINNEKVNFSREWRRTLKLRDNILKQRRI